MKRKFLSFLLLIGVMLVSLFTVVSCGGDGEGEMIDYASQVKLDLNSTTHKQEVTVVNYIDGDTTHFNVPDSIVSGGTLKARYLAVNTPESTGKIEEWGKKASNYTKEKLKSATSIIIETDSEEFWPADSTGERRLVWVWYKSADMTDYSCLNIELLQNGLAVGSKASETRYGETCVKAIDQAKEFKLHVHSNEDDPDYYYGAAVPVDLKELRLHIEDYVGTKVTFDGIVTQYSNNGVYVESYDNEAQEYYGIYVYYGFSLSPYGVKILTPGNYVRIVGSVQYWETGDSYQISGVDYDPFEPTNPDKIQQLDKEKHEIPNKVTTAETFNSTLRLETSPEVFEDVAYGEVMLNTTITMENLAVKSVYTTNNGGDNDGAITITCKVGNQTITVRTAVLYDPNDSTVLIKEDVFKNKTITVKGIVEKYDGKYQIKLFSINDVTFQN